MFSAKTDIAFVATDFDLLALLFYRAIKRNTNHHGGFSAAKADGFEFVQGVGPCKQGCATREKFALKNGADSVAHNRDV